MPFNTALSAGEITQVQKNRQSFHCYLLANPNDIIWQAQVDDTKSGEVYASFDWTTTLQGDRTNVKVGMLVLVTEAADDFNRPIIRGRIRSAAPDATTVTLNESSADIDNTMFVTVIDDYPIMERLQRFADGKRYKDWDLTWQDLPPSIDGLQSVYADVSGSATTDFSFAPTATAHASGASISSWLWDVGDGSITVGSTTTQNITVRFTLATSTHRWVHLTVTDSNNNATTFHFEVYTVDLDSSSEVIKDIQDISVTGTIDDGWNATISPWANFSRTSVLDQTRVALVSVDDYDGTTTPVVSNIMMVGRLKTENSNTTGHERHGTLETSLLNIEGFGSIMARLPAPSMSIEDVDSAGAWGEIVSADPTRAIIFFLAFHTTYLSLSSISFDDFSAYVFPDLSVQEPNALGSINFQADSVNATTMFAPAGETTIRRKASYLTTADRSGLTTVYDFVTGDMLSFSTPTEYGQTVGAIQARAAVYDTTTKELSQRYAGRAPAESFGQGHEETILNAQILEADATGANAVADIKSRTANHLRFVNPKYRLDNIGLMDGFWFLIPTLHQRYTFTIAATDTVRGKAWTSSDYWQLTNISYSCTQNERTNRRTVSATFIEETTGGNAGVIVSLIPDPADFFAPTIPVLSGYSDFVADPDIYYPTDANVDLGTSGVSILYPPQNQTELRLGEQVLNVNMRSGALVITSRASTSGETYLIKVQGQGVVETAAGETETVTFDAGSNYSIVSSVSQFGLSATATLDSGFGEPAPSLQSGDDGETPATYGVFARINLEAIGTVTSITFRVYDTHDSGGNLSAFEFVEFYDEFGTLLSTSSQTGSFIKDDWNTRGFTGIEVENVAYMILGCARTDGGTPTNTVFNLDNCVSTIAGRNDKMGDAFYNNYNLGTPTLYGAGKGLLINSAVPGNIPVFNEAHSYELSFTGTGNALSFRFLDADLTDNSNVNLVVTVIGDNMGYTA